MPVHYLVDIDETLALGTNDPNNKDHVIYNNTLIEQFKALGVTNITLLSGDLRLDARLPNRTALIQHLAENGITVDNVIYTHDLILLSFEEYKQVGLGVSYTLFQKPLEELQLKFTNNGISPETVEKFRWLKNEESSYKLLCYLIERNIYNGEDTVEAILKGLEDKNDKGLNKVEQSLVDHFKLRTQGAYPFDLANAGTLKELLCKAIVAKTKTLGELCAKVEQQYKTLETETNTKLSQDKINLLTQNFDKQRDYYSNHTLMFLINPEKVQKRVNKGAAYLAYVQAKNLTDNDRVIFIDDSNGHRASVNNAEANKQRLICLPPVQASEATRDADTYITAEEFHIRMLDFYAKNNEYDLLLKILIQFKTNERLKTIQYQGMPIGSLIDEIATAVNQIKASTNQQRLNQLSVNLAIINAGLAYPDTRLFIQAFNEAIQETFTQLQLEQLAKYKEHDHYKTKNHGGKTIAQLIDELSAAAEAIQSSASLQEISQLASTLHTVNMALENPEQNLGFCRKQAARAQGHANPLWQALGVAIMALGAALALLGVLVITGTVGMASLPGASLIGGGITATQLGAGTLGISVGLFAGGGALALYNRQKGLAKAIDNLADGIEAKKPAKVPEQQTLLTATVNPSLR